MANPSEREEAVCFDEASEIEWRQWFTDFRQRIWPMFKAEGFTFQQAVMLWRQEGINSRLQQLIEIQGGFGG